MAQEFEARKNGRADGVNRSPERIHAEMAATRAALSDKIDALEDKVTSKVNAVKHAGETVKRSFDLPYQVRQHPWPMIGASVLVGIVLGTVTAGDSDEPRNHRDERNDEFPRRAYGAEASLPARNGFFSEEIRGLKQAAVGALMSLVRNGLRDAFPGIAPQTDRAVDGLTRKLGGEPVRNVFEAP
jgi:ElaB/YqjD/DUF883 family membrane-anchored ribosome-binding protein